MQTKPELFEIELFFDIETVLFEIELFFDIETVFTQNWIVWNRTVLTINCVQTKPVLILN